MSRLDISSGTETIHLRLHILASTNVMQNGMKDMLRNSASYERKHKQFIKLLAL